MKTRNIAKKYKLSGGSEVVVLKPFGDKNYCAIVNMPEKSNYPEKGFYALNNKRSEFIFVKEGVMEITLNKVKEIIKSDQSILIRSGGKYQIFAKTKLTTIVMIQDKPGGASEIIKV